MTLRLWRVDRPAAAPMPLFAASSSRPFGVAPFSNKSSTAIQVRLILAADRKPVARKGRRRPTPGPGQRKTARAIGADIPPVLRQLVIVSFLPRRWLLLCGFSAVFQSDLMHAADRTTYASQVAGENWDTPSIWEPSDGLSPHAGDDYHVRQISFQPRTVIRNPVNGNDVTFRGNSLKIHSSAALFLNAKAPGEATTINFEGEGLILEDGGVVTDDDVVFTIAGSFTGGGILEAPRGGFRIDASIRGGRIYHASARSNGPTLEVTSSNPQFEGGWYLIGGWLKGSAIDSLGSGDISLSELAPSNIPSILDVDYDLVSSGDLWMATHAIIRLDQHLTFDKVNIDGVELDAGNYTATELITRFPENFAPIGQGSTVAGALTVVLVPEPNATVFVLTGAVALFALRKSTARKHSHRSPHK